MRPAARNVDNACYEFKKFEASLGWLCFRAQGFDEV
jgi:hypothetical protein